MKFGIPLLVLLAAIASTTDCRAESGSIRPVYTNKSRFRIPYRYDAEEMRRLGAQEVQLFVSQDQGRRWQYVRSVAPKTGHFDFRVPQDGEYWFAVRILDRLNRLHPDEQAVEPGLKVIVDSRPPALQILPRPMGPGKLHLSWQVSDPHLDSRKFRVDYLRKGQSDWQQVSVLPDSRGQTSWEVPEGGTVFVRATVADLAENVSREQRQVRIVPANRDDSGPAPDFRQPIASDARQDPIWKHDVQPPSAARPPLDASDWGGDPGLRGAKRRTDTQRSATMTIAPKGSGLRGTLVRDLPDHRPPITRDRYPDPDAADPSADKSLRVVNARKFHIGYKVDNVGPSGVGSVEVYITEDGGRKWWRYGEDTDHTSPFPVEVSQDGLYGFALRVRSGVGLAAPPPQPGDKPNITVLVDQTPPVVELMPIQQKSAGRSNQVLIRWQVLDDNPADRPIALSYSSSPSGPWEPIDGWRKDTGHYTWTLGSQVPPRLYIRLTARDLAGNMTHITSSKPVIVDLMKPEARIVDVKPRGNGEPHR